MTQPLILAINPGSTSTKLALFKGENQLFKDTIKHTDEEISAFKSITSQLQFRFDLILGSLKQNQFAVEQLDAVVGRGGFLKSIPSGTYIVDKEMIEDLRSAKYGEHASNLGAMLAYKIAESINKKAYIVDPIVVDEFEEVARISGLPDLERRSNFHALNIKAVSRKVAKELGREYTELNFVVAHLGSGISVAAHKKGRVIDVNNANNEGPFSPERTGTLPGYQLVQLCFSGKYTEKELLNRMSKGGGLYAYLGTKNAEEIERRIKEGDTKANLVLDSMIYQVAKEIGGMSAVMDGEVDGIILTGGLSYSDYIVQGISNKINFIAPLFIVKGEEELEALASGALRVLQGKEIEKIYNEFLPIR